MSDYLPPRKIAIAGQMPKVGAAAPGVTKAVYDRQTATESDASRSEYDRRDTGLTPGNVEVNEDTSPQGFGLPSSRNNTRSAHDLWMGGAG